LLNLVSNKMKNAVKINIGSIKKNIEICNLKLMINSSNFFPAWTTKTNNLVLIFINYTNIISYFIPKNNPIQSCINFS